jgi:hypothetical protein
LFEAEFGGSLRQGDLSTMDHFPFYNLEKARALVDLSGRPINLQLPIDDRIVSREPEGNPLVAVCSHDCDVENPQRRTGILVAPITRVPARVQDERHDLIMKSGKGIQLNDEIRYDFINLFPMTLPAELGGECVVVDFSALTSIGPARAARDRLTAGKCAQLDEAARAEFRNKLGSFVARGS